jgi:Na+-transporting methylmalonyl-CoA/oxaloacetate decarboxylase gamma subunit
MRCVSFPAGRRTATWAFTLLETSLMLVILIVFTMVVAALARKAWRRVPEPVSQGSSQAKALAPSNETSSVSDEEKPADPKKSPIEIQLPPPAN